MTGVVLLCGLVYAIVKFNDCGRNPEYEEWIREDRSKYPDLYK